MDWKAGGETSWARRWLLGACAALGLIPRVADAQQPLYAAPPYGVPAAAYPPRSADYPYQGMVAPPGAEQIDGLWYANSAAACPPSGRGMPRSPAGYYTSDHINTWYPEQDDDWLEPSPFERAITSILRNSWFRVEYMLWQIEEPGNALLGSPDTLNTLTPREFFLVEEPDGSGFDAVRVEDLGGLRLNDVNGVRASWGFPTGIGLFEANIWGLAEHEDEQISRELPDLPIPDFTGPNGEIDFLDPIQEWIATTTTFNGQVTDAVRIYDVSFDATFRSNVWGANAMFIFEEAPNVPGFSLSPLAGFGYLSLREDLEQVGVFSNGSTNQADFLTTRISSETKNDIYGPKAGLRAEFRHEHFVLGAQSSLLAGANTYHANVESRNFVQLGDSSASQSEETTFSAIHECAVYARVHVRDCFWLTLGYDLMTAFRVTRPQDNIVYDTNADATNSVPISSNIHVDEEIQPITLQGFRVGGEIAF